MKIIILSGGFGTRLLPLTAAVNKHLLPVGHKSMIAYATQQAQKMGFQSALYITTNEALTPLAKLFGTFSDPTPYFLVQDSPNGIAHAISLGEDYCGDESITVLLGDNIFDLEDIEDFIKAKQEFNSGCVIWEKTVPQPSDYGVIDHDNNIIVEKPKIPPSSSAVVGMYMFDNTVWDRIKPLTPSGRGEYEVTDLINTYLSEGKCKIRKINGCWDDLGRSIDEYLRISATRVIE